MQNLVHDLATVLSRQLDLYRKIRDLIEEERIALLGTKPDAVLQIVHRKETHLLQIRVLEESRELTSLRLAKKLGVDRRALTVSEIEKRAGADFDPRLGRVREKLRECLDEIRKGNADNNRICQNGIELIEQIVESVEGQTRRGDSLPYGSQAGKNVVAAPQAGSSQARSTGFKATT